MIRYISDKEQELLTAINKMVEAVSVEVRPMKYKEGLQLMINTANNLVEHYVKGDLLE